MDEVPHTPTTVRCPWAEGSAEMAAYHDQEWGVRSHDDRHLFEMLTLEGAQAGLSWLTILRKRQGYHTAFADFYPAIVAQYTDADIDRLMDDAGIVRNRAKITATILNARKFADVQREFGSFDQFLEETLPECPIRNRNKTMADIPSRTHLSDRLSRELVSWGFKFVGSTICYAFMQAVGLVDDHVVTCFRHGAGEPAATATRRRTAG